MTVEEKIKNVNEEVWDEIRQDALECSSPEPWFIDWDDSLFWHSRNKFPEELLKERKLAAQNGSNNSEDLRRSLQFYVENISVHSDVMHTFAEYLYKYRL
jgi:hypothetical protein